MPHSPQAGLCLGSSVISVLLPETKTRTATIKGKQHCTVQPGPQGLCHEKQRKWNLDQKTANKGELEGEEPHL